ncbi:hypothetical protein P885DRAFT_63610 [Corynascus similis CBS 632.67]
MVKCVLPLATLALSTAALTAAAPNAWVEDLIANPDTALTVDEAIAAAHAADVIGSAGGLQARAPYCDQPWESANARDAAACVDALAAKGKNGQNCVVDRSSVEFCRIGNAQIVGSKVGDTKSANCNDIARTAGLIFDSCWRADDTVKGSEYCVSNRGIQVNIAKP